MKNLILLFNILISGYFVSDVLGESLPAGKVKPSVKELSRVTGFFLSVTELQKFFRDADQDGRGNAAQDTLAETQPAGWVLDSTDCDDGNPIRFRQTPKPRISLAGGGTAFCIGETGIIQVQEPDTAFIYGWSTGNEGLNLSMEEVDSSGAYFVIATADSGCPAKSDSLILSEVSQLVVTSSIIVSPSNTICTGTFTTFKADIKGGGNDPFIEWYLNDLFVELGSTYSSDSLNNGDQLQMILTSSAGCGTPIVAISQKITMTVQDSIQANAGSDATTCGTEYVLQGNASGFWSVISGNAVLQNASSATTMASGLAASGNRFVWTVSGGTCPESSDTIEINSVEQVFADAGFDRILCASSGNLQGNGTQGNGVWKLISGDITLEDSLNPVSPFSNLAEGNTLLEWKIFAGICPESRDTVLLSRETGPSPAQAGIDQSICDSSAQLSATAPLIGQGSWSVLSGGGNISNADSAVCSITGLQEGVTVLVWSVSNGLCPASTDSLRLEVAFPRKASAGADLSLCDSAVTLQGNNPGVGGGIWFILSGAGTLADSSQPNTVVSNLGIGENLLVWTLENGACPSDQDTITIVRELAPGISIAGADQDVCGNNLTLSANFPAVGTGIWNIISGNALLSDSLNPLAQLNGTENTSIRLEWLIQNGSCPSSRDTIQVNFFGPPSPPQAGSDQNACNEDAFLLAQSPLNGSGSWRVISGSGILSDSLSIGTAVANLSTGSNVFEWTVVNGACPGLSDTVIITRFADVISLGTDTLLCEGETLNLSLQAEYQNILWSDGSTGNSLLVDSAGIYFVQANGPGGCLLSDSIAVSYTICTEIKPLPEKVEIRAYPNPFSDEFEISLSGFSEEILQYRIISSNGIEIGSGDFAAKSGKFIRKIRTGFLPAGLYILEIRGSSILHYIRLQVN